MKQDQLVKLEILKKALSTSIESQKLRLGSSTADNIDRKRVKDILIVRINFNFIE